MSTTQQLATTLRQIDARREEMQQMGDLSPDTRARLGRKFRLEMNYHSNSIEGNELDFGDTKSLLLRNVTASGKPLKDHLEMRGHDNALTRLREVADAGLPITESLIKEFHKILIVDPFTDQPDNIPGAFKDNGNYLYNDAGERVDFLPPDQVTPALNDLINFVNNALNPPKARKQRERRELYDVHPVVLAAQFHQRFIQIHPFTDGNGRMARIFMNLILLRTGFPPIVIRQEEKRAYYRALDRARDHDTEEFTLLIAQHVLTQQEFYLAVANGAPVEEEEDWKKRILVLKNSLDRTETVSGKTKDNIWKLCSEVVLPLFKRATKDFNQFDDLYKITTRSYIIDSHGPSANMEGIEPFKAKVGMINGTGIANSIRNLRMTLRWSIGPLPNDKKLSFDCLVSLLQEDVYSIEMNYPGNRQERLVKKYGESISSNVINDMISKAGRGLIEEAEKQLKS